MKVSLQLGRAPLGKFIRNSSLCKSNINLRKPPTARALLRLSDFGNYAPRLNRFNPKNIARRNSSWKNAIEAYRVVKMSISERKSRVHSRGLRILAVLIASCRCSKLKARQFASHAFYRLTRPSVFFYPRRAWRSTAKARRSPMLGFLYCDTISPYLDRLLPSIMRVHM